MENLPTPLTPVAGTSADMLRSEKLPANNTTGHKGVYLIKGKCTAKIVLQQKGVASQIHAQFLSELE